MPDTFDTIDWSEQRRQRVSLSTQTIGSLVSIGLLGMLFAYDYFVVSGDDKLVAEWDAMGLPGWDVIAIDWLFMFAMVVIGWYLVYPLVTTPGLVRYYWRRLRTNRRGIFGLAVLVCFYAVGIAGPVALDLLREFTGITGAQTPRGITPLQPPMGLSASASLVNDICAGSIVDGRCMGTIYHPLGTNGNLEDMLVVTVDGAQSAMQVATVVAVFAAPLGIAAGVSAAYFGGRVDELLMRYVDLQIVIPPFFVYLFVQVFVGRSFPLLVVVFGLLNWGSIARLVRSEALSKAELGYMRAAEDAGSRPLRTIRKHLLPNVSNTVVTGVTLMMPTVILVEVTLAFIQASSPSETSWGNLISGASTRGAGTVTIDGFQLNTWWTELFPVFALLLTVLAFNAFGDALRDVLDPKTEGER